MPAESNPPEWVEEAQRLRPTMGYKKIASRLGVTYNQVYYWLRVQTREVGNQQKTCETCGEPFRAYNSLRRYCSPACHSEAQRGNTEMPVRTPESYRSQARKLRKTRRGKGNPNFKTGRRVGQNEREMMRRFNLALKGEGACRNCGVDRNLQLHHVIPRSKCRATRMELLNGLPLCTDCHMGWHRRYRTIYRDVFTEEEWAFLVAVRLTGEEIGPWLDERYPDRGRPFRVPTSLIELARGEG